ncbi:MAG TPA: GNAT family N-acetyltransferase [Xanthobacteraceae bacterium]|nr:GNAT family N-acetyltransferase [Xanthobacteraceae bacterium]
MSLDVAIRDFVASDREEVIALLLELQRYECQLVPDYAAPDRAFGAWYLDRLMEELRQHQGVMIVAIRASALCGFCAGFEEESPEERSRCFYIAELAVAEVARDRGVGTRLIAAIEEIARARGYRTVEVGVLADNQRVHRLYRRLGFRDHAVKLRKRLQPRPDATL